MDIKNITIDLNIKESRRIRGYSDNATVEFELTHPEFKGSLRFEARRNNIKETLERLNIGVKKKELFENVSLEDVAYELSIRSLGIPLSDSDRKEIGDMLKKDSKESGSFKIKIG